MMTTHPALMSGALVLLPSELQAVVRHAWDGEPVEVVPTGGDGGFLFFDADDLVALPAPSRLNAGVCLKCGDVWKWHGDRTSHCPSCCQTFEGGILWDAHRIQGADGKFSCRRAAAMEFKGVRLRKEADEIEGIVTTGTWRGRKVDGRWFAE